MSRAVGVVPTGGRGSMPFALLHGEPLVAVASWAIGEADVRLLDFDAPWQSVVAADLPLLVHDPLCPGTPSSFLVEAVERAVSSGAVVVGARPVTDTVKETRDGRLGATADRSALVAVTSPVVLPAFVVAALGAWPPLDDVPAWVAVLREQLDVAFLEAPSAGRRVSDPSDVLVLEAALPGAP